MFASLQSNNYISLRSSQHSEIDKKILYSDVAVIFEDQAIRLALTH